MTTEVYTATLSGDEVDELKVNIEGIGDEDYISMYKQLKWHVPKRKFYFSKYQLELLGYLLDRTYVSDEYVVLVEKLKDVTRAHDNRELIMGFVIANQISESELRDLLKLTRKEADLLLGGELAMTEELVVKLSDLFGTDTEFWVHNWAVTA